MHNKRQPGRTNRRLRLPQVQASKRHRSEALQVFARVYKLLEEYGPRWYSLNLRQELRAALRSFRH
jgi:hypothetical protein